MRTLLGHDAGEFHLLLLPGPSGNPSPSEIDCRAAHSLLQIFCEEGEHSPVSVGCIRWPIAALVAGILETMTRVRIVLHIDWMTDRLHRGGKIRNILRRDATILRSKIAQDSSLNLLQLSRIGFQRAVVN